MARRQKLVGSGLLCLVLVAAAASRAAGALIPVSITTSFATTYIPLNGTTTLTYSMGTASSGATGVGFTDTLPGGVQVANPSNAQTNCSSATLTADPGASTVTLSNGVMGPFTGCSVQVDLQGTTRGDKTNHVTVSSSVGGGSSTTYLSVGAPDGAAKLVKDIDPGSNDGMGLAIATIGKIAYFPATDGVHGMELWRSDGTRAGTKMVKDIDPGSAGSLDNLFVGEIAPMGGILYFAANDGTHGIELWKSNGTASGTKMVKNINPGGDSSPSGLTSVGGILFFSANDGTHGIELWKSNGTASGTKMVKNINSSSDSIPEFLTNFGGTLVFIANDGTHGVELWRSNGTSAGTQLVRDINPTGDGFPFLATQLIPFFTSIKGTLYFVADDGTIGPQLWKSNGTKVGTKMVRAISPPGSAPPTGLMNLNGTLFFSADDGIHGPELWRSNGTSAGTRMVKDINPGADGSYPSGMTDFGGILIFSSDVGTHYGELWRSDGTSSGTRLVRDINPVDGAFPMGFRDIGGTLLFQAQDPDFGTELYRSDGTRAGTKLVDDINVSGGSGPNLLVDVGGRLLFSASDLPHGNELWRYKP